MQELSCVACKYVCSNCANELPSVYSSDMHTHERMHTHARTLAISLFCEKCGDRRHFYCGGLTSKFASLSSNTDVILTGSFLCLIVCTCTLEELSVSGVQIVAQ